VQGESTASELLTNEAASDGFISAESASDEILPSESQINELALSELLINKSSALELATYLIVYAGISIKKDEPLQVVLRRFEWIGNINKQYVEQVLKALTITCFSQHITIFKTSIDCDYSSPMKAVCFRDGDIAYVQYGGTPDGGWVQNPISYGADIYKANASDEVSSVIQVDGLNFFNDCVTELTACGFSGKFVIGGHSQGGNVAEYVTVSSEHLSKIELCVSLDGPNHSKELYDYLIEKYGSEFMRESRQKIIAVNGHNDYVNMQGQLNFALPGNTFYLITDDIWAEENGYSAFPGWHDALYMTDRINGGLLPYNAQQGPVGKIMGEVVSAIISLPQEIQEDSAMSIMGMFELLLGSKNWNHLMEIGIDAGSAGGFLVSEEFIGFMARGFPAVLFRVIRKPLLIAKVLLALLPKKIKKFLSAFLNSIPVIFAIVATTVTTVLFLFIFIISMLIVGLYGIANIIVSIAWMINQKAHDTVS